MLILVVVAEVHVLSRENLGSRGRKGFHAVITISMILVTVIVMNMTSILFCMPMVIFMMAAITISIILVTVIVMNMTSILF